MNVRCAARRGLSALFALAALAGAVHAADPGMFPPAREPIPEPYTDDKCLKNCHGEPDFAAGSETGRRKALSVDPKAFAESIHALKGLACIDCHPGTDPNFHPRTGYPKAQCRACHSRTPPADAYPPNALALLAKKGIPPPPETSLNAEDYRATKHGAASAAGREEAPTCSTCHTAHAIQPAFDPRSTVHAANLLATCGACHADRFESYNVGGALAKFRISGHGKGDLAGDYSATACLSCHPGQGAHNEPPSPEKKCPSCHRTATAEGEKAPVPFHLVADPASLSPTALLGLAYTAGLWLAGVAVAALLVLFGVSALLPARGETKDKK